MKKTFTHQVRYLEEQPVLADGSDEPEIVRVPVEKIITFQELDQLNRDQHDLHFEIMAYYSSGTVKTKGKKTTVDAQFAMGITREFLDIMIVYNEEFTVRDKEIMMNDSACLVKLSMFLIPEKVFPFFLELTKNIAA